MRDPNLPPLEFLREFSSLVKGKVVLRFHGDADGIVSAILLKKAFGGTAFISRTPWYSREEAFRDLSLLAGGGTLLLADLGSSMESLPQIRLISRVARVIILDHHPPEFSWEASFNPWEHGLDSSITTGMMAARISEDLGIEVGDLPYVSAAGDLSPLLPWGRQEARKALALDYASHHTSSLSLLERCLEEPLLSELVSQAEDLLERAVRSVVLKEEELGGLVLLHGEVSWRGFPGKGKVANQLLPLGRPGVVFLSSGRYFSIRANRLALALGVDLGEFVRRERRAGRIQVGGGHPAAAGGMGEGILISLRNFLGEVLEGSKDKGWKGRKV